MPWEPLPDPVGEPTPLGRPLDTLLSRLAGAGAEASGSGVQATEVIFDRWPEIVGAGLAQYSRPTRIEGGCLVVAVTDAAFGAELRWQERTILRRITELAGTCPVERVRVVST